MKKLLAYLDKIGANYEIENYGEKYFYNAAPIEFRGALVYWDFNSQDDARKYCQQLKMIERYAARYGYAAASRGGALGSAWVTVWKSSDAESYGYYRDFSNAAHEEFLQVAHEYHTGRRPGWSDKDLNDAAREIMDRHGEAYNEFLAAITA